MIDPFVTTEICCSARGVRCNEKGVGGFLADLFQIKSEWPSNEIYRLASEAGYSKAELYEAKSTSDIRARKVTERNGDTMWFWVAPTD